MIDAEGFIVEDAFDVPWMFFPGGVCILFSNRMPMWISVEIFAWTCQVELKK